MEKENGECHLKAKFHAPDPPDYIDSICSNPDLLKLTHSLQGMLSLIDPTGCCVMERRDGECPDPEVKLYHRGAHRRRYLGKPVGEMDYVWGDNESMSNNSTVPEALFLDDTLEVDVSIAEGSIFGILGSEKRCKKPMTDGEQIASMYSMYTTVRRVLPVR